ncbi:ABC transporter permease [Verrucomicrobiota bacterium]
MPFPLFLALKYLKPKRSFISVVTLISVIGVLIGVAILVIVLSVMTGFDNMWREKILSFKPHITVSSWHGVIRDEEALCRKIETIPGITGVSPVIETLTLMQYKGRSVAPYVIGMDPDRAASVSRVSETNFIRFGKFDLNGNNTVIGQDMASSMGISEGDKVLVYSPQNVMSKDELYLPEELTVSGIFNMGMRDFDSGFILTSLEVARDLLGLEDGTRSIYIMTEDPFRFEAFSNKVRAMLPPSLSVSTWKDVDQMLFAALSHEKTLMFILLVFITIVAIFCVTNTIIVIIVRKTNEIGLLKALGFSSGKIMGAFVWMGWIQCLVGCALGVGVGLLILNNMEHIVALLTKIDIEVFPKGIYGLDKIPCSTSVKDVAGIVLLVIVFCTLGSLLPARRAANLDPVDALRHE